MVALAEYGENHRALQIATTEVEGLQDLESKLTAEQGETTAQLSQNEAEAGDVDRKRGDAEAQRLEVVEKVGELENKTRVSRDLVEELKRQAQRAGQEADGLEERVGA